MLIPPTVFSPLQQTCEMEAPRILITDRKINNMNELERRAAQNLEQPSPHSQRIESVSSRLLTPME